MRAVTDWLRFEIQEIILSLTCLPSTRIQPSSIVYETFLHATDFSNLFANGAVHSPYSGKITRTLKSSPGKSVINGLSGAT
jgi:hypothetical protein